MMRKLSTRALCTLVLAALLAYPAAAQTGSGGTGGSTGGSTGTGTGTGRQINQGQMVSGLTNANINIQNLTMNNIVNVTVNNTLPNDQLQNLIQVLQKNPQAMQAADRLTQQLLQAKLLQQGQRVVGVIGDRIFIAPDDVFARDGRDARDRPRDRDAMQINQGQLLSGLINANINVQNLTINNIVNITINNVMPRDQFQNLIQVLQKNPQAMRASDQLTQQLLQRKLIDQGLRVVGVLGDRVFVAPDNLFTGDTGTPNPPNRPDRITQEQLLNGLINLNLNLQNLTAQNVVNLQGANLLPNNQVVALVSALNNNVTAKQNADRIAQALRQAGLLPDGFRVVGVIGDRVFFAPNDLFGRDRALDPLRERDRDRGLDRDRMQINQGQLLSGLINANINVQNLTVNNFVNVTNNNIMSNDQVQQLIRTLSKNPQAMQASDRLTQQLLQARLLQQGQRVVGVNGDRIFTAPDNLFTPGGGDGSRPVRVTQDHLINGLINANLNVQNLTAQNVINLQSGNLLTNDQIGHLASALNSNAAAKQMADRLTQQLLQAGLITNGFRVVGVIGDRVYIARLLSQ